MSKEHQEIEQRLDELELRITEFEKLVLARLDELEAELISLNRMQELEAQLDELRSNLAARPIIVKGD
jgi:hypothetical protein